MGTAWPNKSRIPLSSPGEGVVMIYGNIYRRQYEKNFKPKTDYPHSTRCATLRIPQTRGHATRLLLKRNRTQKNDEVWQPAVRLSPRSRPPPRTLLRMHLQSSQQDCQPQALSASDTPVSSSHTATTQAEIAPHTTGATVASCARTLSEAETCQYHLTKGYANSPHS